MLDYEFKGSKKMDLLPLALILTGIVLIILAAASAQKKQDIQQIKSIEDRLDKVLDKYNEADQRLKKLETLPQNLIAKLDSSEPLLVEILNKPNVLAPKADKKVVKNIKKRLKELSK